MGDRSDLYTRLERNAALEAVRALPRDAGAVRFVDAVLAAIGMKPAKGEAEYQDLTSAPRDRDVILRTPKRGDVRACWWRNWEQPGEDSWCWREARADGTVGGPIEEADGWREL